MTNKEQARIEAMAEKIEKRMEQAKNVVGSMNKGKGYWIAEALYNAGYHKTVWHKVADGDLPEIYRSVLVAVKRTVKDCDDYIFTTIGNREPYTMDVAIWDIQGLSFSDKIIAWTELPKYKE